MIVVAYKIQDGLNQEAKIMEINYHNGITPLEISNYLNIKNYYFIRINGFRATGNDPVSDGDKVTFLPYIAGG